jgi:uroporphyrinogen decarboxylase
VTKREVVHTTLRGDKPPYVPWSCGFTAEARDKLTAHFGSESLEEKAQNHMVQLGNPIGFFDDLGDNLVRDVFGVVWDRSIDQDIGKWRIFSWTW